MLIHSASFLSASVWGSSEKLNVGFLITNHFKNVKTNLELEVEEDPSVEEHILDVMLRHGMEDREKDRHNALVVVDQQVLNKDYIVGKVDIVDTVHKEVGHHIVVDNRETLPRNPVRI